MLKNIFLSFIPLFVAVDAIGVLPIFVSLTEGMEQKARSKVILQSMLTAAGLAIGFVLVGKLVFKFLGITMGDFIIAGVAILFCLAIIDMVSPTKERRIPSPELGAVPLDALVLA
jgi:multiple antibiotic resistance protein